MRLLDRLPLRRRPPEAPEQRSRYGVLQDMVVERLRLRRAQAFANDLLSLEDYWPVLIPLLAWVGWRTYRRERRTFLSEQRARSNKA
jgi:hypothetical protein